MTKGADLYRLQCLDSEKDSASRRLEEVRTALGENEALRQARAAVEKVHEQVGRWATKQRDLELEIQSIADKRAGSEARLYGGAVKNPKELSDLQAEIDALRRRRQELEDRALEAMIKREEAEDLQAQAQQHLEATEAQWSASQSDLIAEQAELQKRLAEIEQALSGLWPKIEDDVVATYQALRKNKGGMAVIQVREGACGACGLSISPSLEWQLREGQFVYCSNCQRIIVRG